MPRRPCAFARGLSRQRRQQHAVQLVERFGNCQIGEFVEIRFAQPVDACEHHLGDEGRRYFAKHAIACAAVDKVTQPFNTHANMFLPDGARRWPAMNVGDSRRTEMLCGPHPDLQISVDALPRVVAGFAGQRRVATNAREEAPENQQYQRMFAGCEVVERPF